jgi:hypothetical protein
MRMVSRTTIGGHRDGLASDLILGSQHHCRNRFVGGTGLFDYRRAQLVTVIGPLESPPQRIGSPLKIEFGNDERYERIEHFNETGIFRRTIFIAIFNESADDISDCNIKLIAATPRPKTGDSATNFPVGFSENFDLRSKQRKFIQIVRFAENHGSGSALERDNIIILAASGGFFPGWTRIPITSRDSPAILTLEAFAPSIESRTAHLHIWVIQRRIHAQII